MLRVEGLTRYYGRFLALDHLDLTVGDGELHGFVGPNGAGKTTAMRILAMLMPASSGYAEINGVSIRRSSRRSRSLVGYMPDFFGTYDNLKAWEYLDFYARCYGINAADRKKIISQLLDLVGLRRKREAYVNSLSRGMKQRLCMARALIHDPQLLIFDEPASGMDPGARADMKTILKTLRDMGKTVLISSHILPELSEICDSLTILSQGKRVFSGSVESLAQKMNADSPLEIRFCPDCPGESIDRAVLSLRQMPQVAGIRQDEPKLLRVRLNADAQQCGEILRALMASGAPICDFHRSPMDLEKVFLEVTGNA